jgi:hypothetical protein
MSAPIQSGDSPASITSGGQFAGLIFRYFVGYGVMFVCVLLLLRRGAWDFSAVDVVFWATLVVVLFLHRLAAVREGTLDRWPGLALRHLAIAGVLWGACHSGQLID